MPSTFRFAPCSVRRCCSHRMNDLSFAAMRTPQFGWYVLQIAIVVGVFAFSVEILFPMMADPVGLHVPLLIGLGLAFVVTDLLAITFALVRRLRLRLRYWRGAHRGA